MARVVLSKRKIESRRVSDWVRWHLRDTKKSQKELADYLGITQQALSAKMCDKAKWMIADIADCCDFFGDTYTIGL